MKKKLVALALAVMCAAGGTGTAFASTFADINDVPWSGAAQYIDEAASLGLMAGYTENGKKYCKAKNSVTYAEAVQLMYSIMCSYSSTNKTTSDTITKWTSTMKNANIPSWAYESVAYALENSILTTSDLKVFMSSASKQNNARREDVAVIFGKALSKIYNVNSSATISYADKSSVSASSVPYLEMLNRLNLMIGDSNNKFNPKANINRAEMAVLSTKTHKQLKGSTTSDTTEQVTGEVVSVSGNIVKIKVNSTERSITMNSSAAVMYNGNTAKLTDIKEGDKAVVVVTGGIGQLISAVSSSGTQSDITAGTISSITKAKITITKSSKTATYRFNDNYNKTTLTLDGKTTKDIDDLIQLVKDGATITANITADKNGYVTKIVATTEATNSKLKGDLESLTTSRITIKNGTKSYSYYLLDDTDDITVTIDGKTKDFDTLKDNFKNDNKAYVVTLTLNSKDEVKKIVAESGTTTSSTSGTLTKLTSSKITIKSGSTSYSYDLISKTANIDVTIDGKTKDFSDLKESFNDDGEEYTVKLTLNSDKEVKAIVATSSSSSSSSTSGTLTKLTEDSLRIKTSSGSYKSYDLKSSVTVTIDGSSSTLSKLISRFDAGKSYTVKLTLSGTKVSKIAATLADTASSNTEGQISSIEDDRIQIKTSSGSYKTYTFASAGCDFYIDGKLTGIDKVITKYGDGAGSSVKAYITLNSADRAKEVKITTGNSSSVDDKEGDIISISSSSKTIKIQLSNGNKVTYDVYKNCTVTIDGSSSTLSKLETKVDNGDKFSVVLTYDGDEVTKIKASTAKETRSGTLVSIDEDYITVKSDGTNYKYALAGSVTLIVDGDDDIELNRFINYYSQLNNYNVDVTRNANNKVTKIVAKKIK